MVLARVKRFQHTEKNGLDPSANKTGTIEINIRMHTCSKHQFLCVTHQMKAKNTRATTILHLLCVLVHVAHHCQTFEQLDLYSKTVQPERMDHRKTRVTFLTFRLTEGHFKLISIVPVLNN
jgi:hypothetical protein